MYFLSCEMLITAPGKRDIIFLITGPDRGEKFRVGSSKISPDAGPYFLISSFHQETPQASHQDQEAPHSFVACTELLYHSLQEAL